MAAEVLVSGSRFELVNAARNLRAMSSRASASPAFLLSLDAPPEKCPSPAIPINFVVIGAGAWGTAIGGASRPPRPAQALGPTPVRARRGAGGRAREFTITCRVSGCPTGLLRHGRAACGAGGRRRGLLACPSQALRTWCEQLARGIASNLALQHLPQPGQGPRDSARTCARAQVMAEVLPVGSTAVRSPARPTPVKWLAACPPPWCWRRSGRVCVAEVQAAMSGLDAACLHESTTSPAWSTAPA
jgi:hypothetical protein